MTQQEKTLTEVRAELAKCFASVPGEFVRVSHILGSDWGCGRPDCRGVVATYIAQAYQAAEERFND
jgi:hypothetical protein